jgi:hypothetical protein
MKKCFFAVFCAIAVVGLFSSQVFGAPDSFFDVFLESVSSPPVPSSPTKTWVQNPVGPGGSYISTSELDLSLGGSTANLGATTLLMSETTSPSVVIGTITPQYIAPDSFFDVFLECYDPSHGNLSIIGTPVLMAPDSFFDVFLECAGPGAGTTQTLTLHGVPAEGVLFANVGIQNFNGVTGKFNLCGELNLAPGSTYVPGTPAMTFTITGSVVPEPSMFVMLISLGIAAATWKLLRK